MKFRKKPVEVEAVRFTGENLAEIAEFVGEMPPTGMLAASVYEIRTLEGNMFASPGDWIIRGVQGEFYPCKPDIFEQTYEAVE